MDSATNALATKKQANPTKSLVGLSFKIFVIIVIELSEKEKIKLQDKKNKINDGKRFWNQNLFSHNYQY